MTDHALQEQLDGLINLMQAVGIDYDNNREIKKASMALKSQGSGAPIVFPPDVPEAKQLNDDQIQAMILKLQQAQAHAPHLMEALEDYIGQKNGTTSTRGTKKKTKKKGTGKPARLAPPKRDGPHNPHLHYAPEYDEPEYVEPPQNDHDDYDEDEEDDEFDEDADYPMVGPGVSDDCSVVSDMTTPTVVSSIHINEEEQYSDMLPSMYGSGSGPPMMIQPPKRKNLVSHVGRSAGVGVPMRVGPPHAQRPVAGGAAAKRRQTYQQTMSRLQQSPYSTTIAGPAANPNVPVISEGHEDEPLTSQSHHSGAEHSFASTPNDWNAFAGPNGRERSNSLDESANNASTAKPKKKGTKGTKKAGAGGSRSSSPKPRKKKAAAGGTAIDKAGFLVGGAQSSPGSIPKKSKDQLSKSGHSSSGSKKKVVKKRVVKKPSGEGSAPPSRPKKSPSSKRS